MAELKPVQLTGSQWHVLQCLWQESPQTVMQLTARLARQTGWAKSTTITTLRRMEEKGLLRCTRDGKAKHYTPAVERDGAVIQETRHFLNRVYQGSVGQMMGFLVQHNALSREDIAQLHEILRRAELQEILRKAEAGRHD